MVGLIMNNEKFERLVESTIEEVLVEEQKKEPSNTLVIPQSIV